MYKLIDSASFFSKDEPSITIINVEDMDCLVKQAADERITEYVKSIKPEPGKMYCHINALGAGQAWSCNKNGDWFDEDKLLKHYKTFETGPAHVFRHHQNKNPATSIGKVIFSIYNPRMRRVEIIAEIDKELGHDVERRIAAGDYPSTSMAAKVSHDRCSICNNIAKSRNDYCEHLVNNLGQMLPDGRKVMAMNDGDIKFFDISLVVRPADVTSSILQKVAFAEGAVSSAELAEIEKISEEKEAAHRKLADILKEIHGQVGEVSSSLETILSKTKDLDKHLVSQLRLFDFNETLTVLAELGISPSIEFLAELIARKALGDAGRGLGHLAAEYVKNVDPESTELPVVKFEKSDRFNVLVAKLLVPHAERCSLLPEYVEKRAALDGYASFNVNAYEEPKQMEKPVEKHGLFKTLLAIGGTALLAKMYINHLMKEKFKEKAMQDNRLPAKIVLVKKAEDYLTACKLAEQATKRDIQNKKDFDAMLSRSKLVLSGTKTQIGSKASKAIKTIQVGGKLINKLNEGN